MSVEITFLKHILPQIISLVVVSCVFIKSYRYYYNEDVNSYNIGNLALASLLLIYGKVSLFIFSSNLELVKAHIDTSLLIYFAIMPLTLTRMAKINRKLQVVLQIGIIPLLAVILDPIFTQAKIIFSADMYLILILLFSKLQSKWYFILSFAVLGLNNLMTCYVSNYYDFYAWVEIIGQVLFFKGLCKTIKAC